jgi:phage tail tape-measure protein
LRPTQTEVDVKKKATRARGKAGSNRLAHEAEGGASGAIAGAVVGAAAGPVGIVAGAIIGGVAGAMAGAVIDRDSSRQASRTRVLDAQIGVSEGELGAPNLKHPSATVGAYSAASAGAESSSGEDPAEGPMQTPEG